MFDDLWFASLPRVSVETNSRNNLYTNPNDVEITCRVSGITQAEPKVRFELKDVDGTTLLTHETAMQANRPEATSARVFAGSASWRPPIGKDGYGFYRVRVSMPDQTSDAITTNIAILQPFPKPRKASLAGPCPAATILSR